MGKGKQMSNEIEPKQSGNLAMLDTKDVAFANYIMNLLAPFNGFTGFVAAVLAHLKKNDAEGTIMESHYTYQIRTFWIGLLGVIIGLPSIILFGLGLIILGITAIWWMIRNAVGLKYLADGKPMPDPETLFI